MANERIIIEIDASTGKVLKKFKKLEGKGKDAGKKTGKAFSKSFSKSTSKSLDFFKGKLLALGAVAGGIFALKSAVNASAQFEQIRTRLEILTGSAEAAKLVFADLKEFSASTPFQIEDIANSAAQLISFGFSAGTVRDRIKEMENSVGE